MEKKSLTPNIKIWQLGLGFANSNVIFTLVKSKAIEQLRNSYKNLNQLSSESGGWGSFDSGIL